MRKQYYLGLRTGEVFSSPDIPAGTMIGPFRTKRAAEYMRDNPQCETVGDAECSARGAGMSAHPAQALWDAERGELQGVLSSIYWTLRDAVYQKGGGLTSEQVAAMIEAIEVMDHRIMQRRDGA